MNSIDEPISRFISGHHLMTMAVACNNQPYCASVFYVFLEGKNMLVFISDEKTKHIQDALLQNIVAGTIATETENISIIQGIQFTGAFKKLSGNLLAEAKEKYFKRFPLAKIMPADFYGIELTYIKMTDNRWGFGKKLIWKKSAKNEFVRTIRK